MNITKLILSRNAQAKENTTNKGSFILAIPQNTQE
jgi:hypothetical protein